MLNTITRRRTWLQSVLAWWQQRHNASHQQTVSRSPVYSSLPRRYPIPPERAHLYARAADEFF